MTSNLINELTYTYSRDDVFINVFQEGDLYKRSNKGINYPYIFQEKEIFDKIPTVSFGSGGFRDDRRRSVSGLLVGSDHTVSNTTTWVKGRHTFKARRRRSSTRARTTSTRSTSAPSRAARTTRTAGSSSSTTARAAPASAIANAALGLFSNYAELGQRNFTKWRSLATDVFVQDSWKPTSQLTIEGGVRWVLWPPWYSTTNNIANFDPSFYDPAQAAIINPATGRLVGEQGRYNGIVLPGDGFEGDGGDGPDRPAHPGAVPRRAARLLRDALQRLRAASGHVVSAQREDDRPRQRRHLPQPRDAERLDAARRQPAVPAAGHRSPTAAWTNPVRRQLRAATSPSASTARTRSSSTRRPTCGASASSGRFRSASPWTSPTSAAAASICSASATSTSCRRARLPNPGVNIAALRPYKGYNVIRVSENSGNSRYNSLQVSADRRYRNGLKVGFAYTLRQVRGQREQQAHGPLEHLRRLEHVGGVGLSTVATSPASTTSTTCRSCATRAR